MPEEEEKERGFKVADRRRFSAEGEAKPEVEDQPAAAPSKPIEKPAPPQPHAHDESQFEGPSEGAQAEASAAYEKRPRDNRAAKASDRRTSHLQASWWGCRPKRSR